MWIDYFNKFEFYHKLKLCTQTYAYPLTTHVAACSHNTFFHNFNDDGMKMKCRYSVNIFEFFFNWIQMVFTDHGPFLLSKFFFIYIYCPCSLEWKKRFSVIFSYCQHETEIKFKIEKQSCDLAQQYISKRCNNATEKVTLKMYLLYYLETGQVYTIHVECVCVWINDTQDTATRTIRTSLTCPLNDTTSQLTLHI